MKVILETRNDGKPTLTLAEHGQCVLRVLDPEARPYLEGSQRARAWQVVSLMDGLTVQQAHQVLELLEPNIQGQVGRPLGWVVDSVQKGVVEIHSAVVPA